MIEKFKRWWQGGDRPSSEEIEIAGHSLRQAMVENAKVSGQDLERTKQQKDHVQHLTNALAAVRRGSDQ